MRNKKITEKAATLLLVLLMTSSFFCVTVTAVESTTAEGTSGPDGAYGAINPDYRISDSPYLRLPDDMLNWTPIVPPEPREVEDMEDPSAIAIYDNATGKVTQIPSDDTTPSVYGLNSTLPYLGLLPPGMVPESVYPPDDRSRITSTNSYPWRTIGKLFLTYPDGATGWCSGAVIGCNNHGYQVLTAGHCVHSQDHGGWASSVKFVPGLNEDYMPYYYAWNTKLVSYVGWTQNEDHRYDMGWVILDRNVGDFTGWMGRITAGSSSSIYTAGVNTAGYPCNVYHPIYCPYPKTPVNSLWADFDNGRTATEHNHWYYMDTQGGQSGSPVWLYNYYGQGNRYIATVHAYGNDGSNSNHGTRLNSAKYQDIYDVCDANPSPTDKADLIDDGQAYSGFSPTTVKPGTTSFQGWCDVRNIGTASSGGFYVSYYASTNTYISTSDHLIGTDYVYSILPFNWKDSDWTGTFPSGVPDGNYYVGWIIDSGDDVTEFDETNNVAYKSSPKLLVDGTDPSASISINSGDTYTDTTSVTLSLTYSDSGSGVDECRYKNSGGSWTSWQTCTPTKSWTLTTGDGYKYVYYEVKDKAGNVKQVNDRIYLDTTDPSASISINSGDTYTDTTSVTLSLTYSDSGSGVDECRYKNSGGSWTSWQTCTPTKSWTLTTGDGTKTVYYQVRDRAGNIRQVYDSIVLDTTKPSVTVNSPNGGEIWDVGTTQDITWTATDNVGVTSIDIYNSTNGGSTYPYTIATGEPNDGTYSWTIPDTPSTTCRVKVVAHDAAGNTGEDASDANFEIQPTSENKVYFAPQHSTAPYCNTVEVEIWVNATNFKSGQINMTYDPSCANVTSYVPNYMNFPSSGWSHFDGMDQMSFMTLELSLTGKYHIGTLTIHCVNDNSEDCTTPLDFIEEPTRYIEESKLFDPSGAVIPTNWIDGSFTCRPGICGDVNSNGKVNMGDVGALHNYVQYGSPIADEWAADVNCDGKINMGDVGALHNYVQYGLPLNCC